MHSRASRKEFLPLSSLSYDRNKTIFCQRLETFGREIYCMRTLEKFRTVVSYPCLLSSSSYITGSSFSSLSKTSRSASVFQVGEPKQSAVGIALTEKDNPCGRGPGTDHSLESNSKLYVIIPFRYFSP